MLDDYQLEPRLVAALAALNRQDYPIAIAALEAIKKQYGSTSWGVTAQLHLIQAYAAVGEFPQALALCDHLAELPQAKVRDWVEKARPILQRKAELSQSLALPTVLAPTPILERAISGQVLRQVSPWRLWVTQMACLGVLWMGGAWLNRIIIVQPLINFFSAWYSLDAWAWAMAWFLTGVLALVIGVGYPWAWVQLLRWKFSLKPLDLITLNTYSPESIKFWGRWAWSGFQPKPQLGFLPTAVPLIFSFGHLRRWVVISQGLLTALAADEIAILISAEIIQLRRGYNLLLGPMVFVRQLIYELYQTTAQCGNYFAHRLECLNRQHQDRQVDAGLIFLNRLIYGCGCVTTALAYGLVWLLEKIIAPAARVRFYFTDRATAAFTGHPNGLSQALIHLSQAMAEVVYQTREVSPLFESLSLVFPVHAAAAITYGSLQFPPQSRDWVKLTAWERQNPLKDWFSLFHSHRFLGIRLQALSIYAQKWQLKPQFEFGEQSQAWTGQRQFWRQLTPVWGLFLGLFLAILVWRGGEFALRTGAIGIKFWWFANLNLMLWGWGSLGLGLGILLRINAYYPEITTPVTDPQLLKPLIESPIALPLDSVPLKLTGRLLRMRGLEHGLGQGLWLETEVGLWQLRALGWWGPFSHLWRSPFGAWGDRQIEVQGWWRRSEVPWIDVEQARCLGSPGLVFWGRAPYWATAIFGLLVLFSLYTFLIAP
ncbi:hypothetical protein Syn6312_3285 [Synechococcus sp. PCC 6312]|nr:hypothetical protein Syn6312_3285 [Synechococcus sp. PCC 6312]